MNKYPSHFENAKDEAGNIIMDHLTHTPKQVQKTFETTPLIVYDKSNSYNDYFKTIAPYFAIEIDASDNTPKKKHIKGALVAQCKGNDFQVVDPRNDKDDLRGACLSEGFKMYKCNTTTYEQRSTTSTTPTPAPPSAKNKKPTPSPKKPKTPPPSPKKPKTPTPSPLLFGHPYSFDGPTAARPSSRRESQHEGHLFRPASPFDPEPEPYRLAPPSKKKPQSPTTSRPVTPALLLDIPIWHNMNDLHNLPHPTLFMALLTSDEPFTAAQEQELETYERFTQTKKWTGKSAYEQWINEYHKVYTETMKLMEGKGEHRANELNVKVEKMKLVYLKVYEESIKHSNEAQLKTELEWKEISQKDLQRGDQRQYLDIQTNIIKNLLSRYEQRTIKQQTMEAAKQAERDQRARAAAEKAEALYNVEVIRDRQSHGGKVYYLVEWETFPAKKDWTWEPEANLRNNEVVSDLIDTFNASRDTAPSQPPPLPISKMDNRVGQKRRRVRVTFENGRVEIFDTVVEAANAVGKSSRYMYMILLGERKQTHFPWRAEYLD
jgi:hypothetical protein